MPEPALDASRRTAANDAFARLHADIIDLTPAPDTRLSEVEVARPFDVTVGGETRRLEAGDPVVIPSDVEHGCVAGTLVDTFAPRRDHFL